MLRFHRKKKVEIIVEAARARAIVEMIEAAGAKGYTVVPNVSGKGNRGVRDDGHLTDVFRNVQIVVIAAEAVARRIVEHHMELTGEDEHADAGEHAQHHRGRDHHDRERHQVPPLERRQRAEGRHAERERPHLDRARHEQGPEVEPPVEEKRHDRHGRERGPRAGDHEGWRGGSQARRSALGRHRPLRLPHHATA